MSRLNLFPYAFLANSLAMTGLLIAIGLAGLSELASDIAIIQGITLALFNSFSANARNLILNNTNSIKAGQLLYYRVVLLLPLMAVGYWLTLISNVPAQLAVFLLMRKSIEWLDEIFLSEMEKRNNRKLAKNYFLLQALLLLLAILWLLTDMPYPFFGIFLWAVMPLLLSGKYYFQALHFQDNTFFYIIKKISPHIGSTTIIGITVYVFRLLIIGLMGKSIAGDLFVAFAIGGVLGSVVANAFGPTIVLAQSANHHYTYPKSLKLLMSLFFSVGVGLCLLSPLISFLNKSNLFWMAIGLSMVGAVPMVAAQLTRHKLLQTHQDHDLFGPDVLMNVVLIAAMPLIYYLGHGQFIAGMYLLSATLAWLCYKSYESYELGYFATWRNVFKQLTPLLACMLVLPIFFQFGSGIFTSTDLFFNSYRSIFRLPIPVSVLASFAILFGIGAFSRARISLLLIFFTFVLMIIALIVGTPTETITQQSKFVQIAQFTLPMFALISGQFFEENKNQLTLNFEKVFFYTVLLVVALQLFFSMLHGSLTLVPSIQVFSIYQYLHYVPIMFIIGYMFVFERLWHDAFKPRLLLFLWLLLAIYAVMTGSLFIVAIYLMCITTYIFFYGKLIENKVLKLFLGVIFITVTIFTYLQHFNLINNVNLNAGSVSMITKAQYGWDQKSTGWNSYLDIICNQPKIFLVGHTLTSDRGQAGSPHNYYLDFIYNFGMIGLLPLLVLILFTTYKTLSNFKQVFCTSNLFFPFVSLVFLLFLENIFYMGLKQPYPGILSFFLWGVYLSRLNQHIKRSKNEF